MCGCPSGRLFFLVHKSTNLLRVYYYVQVFRTGRGVTKILSSFKLMPLIDDWCQEGNISWRPPPPSHTGTQKWCMKPHHFTLGIHKYACVLKNLAKYSNYGRYRGIHTYPFVSVAGVFSDPLSKKSKRVKNVTQNTSSSHNGLAKGLPHKSYIVFQSTQLHSKITNDRVVLYLLGPKHVQAEWFFDWTNLSRQSTGLRDRSKGQTLVIIFWSLFIPCWLWPVTRWAFCTVVFICTREVRKSPFKDPWIKVRDCHYSLQDASLRQSCMWWDQN